MDRRNEWIRHTLDVIETDINKGGKREIEEAQSIAKGKENYRYFNSLIILLEIKKAKFINKI